MKADKYLEKYWNEKFHNCGPFNELKERDIYLIQNSTDYRFWTLSEMRKSVEKSLLQVIEQIERDIKLNNLLNDD